MKIKSIVSLVTAGSIAFLLILGSMSGAPRQIDDNVWGQIFEGDTGAWLGFDYGYNFSQVWMYPPGIAACINTEEEWFNHEEGPTSSLVFAALECESGHAITVIATYTGYESCQFEGAGSSSCSQ